MEVKHIKEIMKYQYFAKKISGSEKRGEMEARDKFELSRILREKGYILVSFKEKEGKKRFLRSLLSLSFFGKVSTGDKMIFSRNLSVMVSAGLPLTRALEILGRQTQNKKFKNILDSLAQNIKKGNSLSESMKKYPGTFSSLFIAMVKVGEESGKLSQSLDLIGEQLGRDYTLRKKIKGAMIYPMIIIAAMIIIGILMLIYVVPTLVSTFKDLGVELPLSTRIIIAISNFLIYNKLLTGGAFAAIILLLGWLPKTASAKKVIDIAVLHLPIFSPLVKKINSARTSRTLASLVSSGVDVLEALSITEDVLQNHRYKEVLRGAKEDIQKGRPISESFKKSDIYPVLLGEMIAVGEETGRLSDMLMRLAVFYEDEVSETTKDMATIIEPILMIIIGTAVGFFAISMIKPMYSMMSAI